MKKNMKWLIFGIIFISFLVFSTSVYAFSFKDIFSWISNIFRGITGYQVLGNETTTTTTTSLSPCPYECCPPEKGYEKKACSYPKICTDFKCVEITTSTISTPTTITVPSYATLTGADGTWCYDSDKEKSPSYNVKGICQDNSGTYYDFCNGNEVRDYYCTGIWNGQSWNNVKCEHGGYDCVSIAKGICSDGACISTQVTTTSQPSYTTTTFSSCPYECCPPDKGFQIKECPYPKVCTDYKCIEPSITTTPTTGCTDSDSGKNYDVKGTARDRWDQYTDYCSNERQITEYYCQDSGDGRGLVVWTIGAVDCKYGCKDGACLPQPTPVCGNGICESEEEKANCPKDCIKCYQDSDCGQSTTTKTCDHPGMHPEAKLPSVSYACTVEYKSTCQNPGTTSSQCMGIGGVACSPCQYGCQNGECISEITQTETCKDSDGLNYYLKGYVEFHYDKKQAFDTCRVINSDTDYYDTYECNGDNCYVLEASCTEAGTAQSHIWKCPTNICKDGACIKGEEIKEQIKCVFLNSEVLVHPSPARPYEKCYADLRPAVQVVCTSDGNVAEENGKKYLYCMANVAGEQGTKLTWKSSCGGYAYTVIDGNDEKVEFNCIPASNVTEEQISGRGFDRAYWQCYDGLETFADVIENGPTCNPAEVWQKIAQISCNNHCKEAGGITKCGVNSFSVSQECYINVEKFVVIPSVEGEKKTPVETTAVPTAEKIEEKKEEILICKDSCPFEGKCYPFGYRKNEKYCSDEGAFKEQLKESEACENNFECSTNVCVDGKCISSSLIQKIISWFKKFFGMD